MIAVNRYLAWCVALVAPMALLMTPASHAMTHNLVRQAGTFVLPAAVPNDPDTWKERERQYVGVLQSDAPPAEKAMACKRLVLFGTQDAVPAIAPLLTDKELASWARTALEAIPGPASDKALREAMGKLQGNLLIGVINSIGRRQDAKAVDGLAAKLEDADAGVASAAAIALGAIGGDQAAAILARSLAETTGEVRSAVAEGSILCAERYLAEGKTAQARKLYDMVCVADVPKQRVLEATRGAILTRGSAGISFLVAQLESSDKGRLGIGLWTARELPGRDVTEALAAELDRLSVDRRPLLLLALADRKDDAVLPAVLKAAGSGSNELRVAAADVLARLGDVSCVPVLLDAAVEENPELSAAARTTLTTLPGADVDAALLARLPQATGRTRQVLIELSGQRQIAGALPAILPNIEDADAGIREAALRAVGLLGEARHAGDLVGLLQRTLNPKDRAEVERALLALSGRCGVDCAPHLVPLMRNQESAFRLTGLRALAVVGGPDALAAVKAAIDDQEETIQDEAVRTLSTWPNNRPGDAAAGEALLALARSDRKMSHQVLGLRGYLHYVRGDKALNNGSKTAKVKDVLPLIQRPEEKRLAISVLGAAPCAGALELLTTLATDPTVTEEACSAMVAVASRSIRGVSVEQRRNALQTAVEKSRNEATKKRAQELLKDI